MEKEQYEESRRARQKYSVRCLCLSIYFVITARKRSLGQGNVLHLCVILFTGGGREVCPTLSRMQTPLGCRPPWVGQTPQGWAEPSWIQTPLGCRPLQMQTPPGLGRSPQDADLPLRCRSPECRLPPPNRVGQTPPGVEQTPLDADPPPIRSVIVIRV